MRYFLITMDRDYINAPQIMNWFKRLDVRNLKTGRYANIPKRMLFRIKENPNTIFTDILFNPFFLVSKKLRDCLKLYEPNLQYKEFILLDKKNRKTQEYFLPTLSEINCLTEKTVFNLDHSQLLNIEIDLDQVKDRGIFALEGVSNRYVIVRLDVVESLLRRGAIGFMLKEVDCIRGGKLCQDKVKKVNI